MMNKYISIEDEWNKKLNKYLNKWDKTDTIPLKMLREIRASETYVYTKGEYEFDNNDPRSCEQRVQGWLKVKSGRKQNEKIDS